MGPTGTVWQDDYEQQDSFVPCGVDPDNILGATVLQSVVGPAQLALLKERHWPEKCGKTCVT